MTRKKILLIEDAVDIQNLLAQLFELEGYEVLSAFHGKEALTKLHSLECLPHIILLDLMMPVMDGYAFRREPRMHPRIATIPTVVMTAERDIHSKRNEIPADAYIQKPLDIDHLLDVVRQNCAKVS